MAFGVGFCQMLGFPSTYLISVEVCNAVAEDEDEKAFLMSRVMPRLVVGGMAAMGLYFGGRCDGRYAVNCSRSDPKNSDSLLRCFRVRTWRITSKLEKRLIPA